MNNSEDTSMRIIKKATCKTLSGKSTLTYQIAVNPDDAIYIRVAGNNGGGCYSDEFVAYDDIQAALENDDEGAAITSLRLTPLFKGKSVNTPSFLLGILKDLRLVRPMKNKQRHHERLNPKPFLDQMEKLTSSSPAAKAKGATKKTVRKAPRKKAAIKKKSAPRKKTAEAV